MKFEAIAEGHATCVVPQGFLPRLRAELIEHGMEPVETGDGLCIEPPEGSVRLTLGDNTIQVRVAAADVIEVQRLRGTFLHMMDHAAEGFADCMEWQGGLPAGSLPPNLFFAAVQGVQRVGKGFLRITLQTDGVADLDQGPMHFRLVLPPDPVTPVWPHLNAAGRTVWPRGRDALHRPAYTFVELSRAGGWFSFDLYEHDNSRATDWARTIAPGDEVAIMGPGGGEFPPGEVLLMGGDETALPAIRRILAQSAPTRRGDVFIATADPEDRILGKVPEGITVHWLKRDGGTGLFDAMRAAPLPGPEVSRFVWMGAEKRLVRAARAYFRDELGLTNAESYLSAYWTAGTSR